MRKIYWWDLQLIRRKIEAQQYSCSPREQLSVSIILPEPCDTETHQFAARLCVDLRKVNLNATISNIIFLTKEKKVKINYEVKSNYSLGSNCINVYTAERVSRVSIGFLLILVHHFLQENR